MRILVVQFSKCFYTVDSMTGKVSALQQQFQRNLPKFCVCTNFVKIGLLHKKVALLIFWYIVCHFTL